MGWPEQVFFFEKPTPPAPPGPFSRPKIDNFQLLVQKTDYFQCYNLSGKDQERDLGGSISGGARTSFFF